MFSLDILSLIDPLGVALSSSYSNLILTQRRPCIRRGVHGSALLVFRAVSLAHWLLALGVDCVLSRLLGYYRAVRWYNEC